MNNSSKIEEIKCRRVYDSRGNPTIETEIITTNGTVGRAISPSGASTGAKEAIELRDDDERYNGKDIKKGLKIINEKIAPLLVGLSCEDQEYFDNTLKNFDNSSQKINMGGNISTSLSIANYLCASNLNKKPSFKYHSKTNILKIPRPEIQIFGGGAHSGNQNSFQDFLIYPITDFSIEEFFNLTFKIFYSAKDKLVSKNNFFGYCDEGGLFPNKLDHFDICEIINESIIKNNLTPGKDIGISIDVAASNFYQNNQYHLYDKLLDKADLKIILSKLINQYNVSLIEDPFEEKDQSSFANLKSHNKNTVEIIGDDLVCTNYNLLKSAINENSIDGIIVKINQCGTISETLEVINLAKKNNLKTILSARSGDTEENFLSHFAIAWNTDMIKVGSFTRSERTSKWNELIRINENI